MSCMESRVKSGEYYHYLHFLKSCVGQTRPPAMMPPSPLKMGGGRKMDKKEGCVQICTGESESEMVILIIVSIFSLQKLHQRHQEGKIQKPKLQWPPLVRMQFGAKQWSSRSLSRSASHVNLVLFCSTGSATGWTRMESCSRWGRSQSTFCGFTRVK